MQQSTTVLLVLFFLSRERDCRFVDPVRRSSNSARREGHSSASGQTHDSAFCVDDVVVVVEKEEEPLSFLEAKGSAKGTATTATYRRESRGGVVVVVVRLSRPDRNEYQSGLD